MKKNSSSNFLSMEPHIAPANEPIQPPVHDESDPCEIYNIYYELSLSGEQLEAEDEDGQPEIDEDHDEIPDEHFASIEDIDDDGTDDVPQESLLSHLPLVLPVPAAQAQENPRFRKFDPTKKYSFSRTLVTETGGDGAILLHYIAMLISKSSRTGRSDQRPYVRTSAGELAQIYPWKERRAWSDTLRTLCRQGFLVANDELQYSGIDRTLSYTIAPGALGKATTDPIYFVAGEAAEHGVCAALLLNNLRNFLWKNVKESRERRAHAMRPKKLAELLPFSVSSIKRALDELTEKGVVTRFWNKRIRANEYDIPGYEPEIGTDFPLSVQQLDSDESINLPNSPEPKQTGQIKFEQIVSANREALSRVSFADIEIVAGAVGKSWKEEFNSFSVTDLQEQRRNTDDQRLAFILDGSPFENVDFFAGLRLEVAVIGLRKAPTEGSSSNARILRTGYELCLEVTRRLQKHSLQKQLREKAEGEGAIEKALARFSPDSEDSTIPAERKAKMFRSMTNERTKFGIWRQLYPDSLIEVRSFPVSVTAGDKRALPVFFSRNPTWTSRNLLDVVIKCCELPEFLGDEHDSQFHARKVGQYGIKFLFNNLDKILKEVELTTAMPPLMAYEVSELYPIAGPAENA